MSVRDFSANELKLEDLHSWDNVLAGTPGHTLLVGSGAREGVLLCSVTSKRTHWRTPWPSAQQMWKIAGSQCASLQAERPLIRGAPSTTTPAQEHAPKQGWLATCGRAYPSRTCLMRWLTALMRYPFCVRHTAAGDGRRVGE